MEQSVIRVLHSTDHPRTDIFEGEHEKHEVLVGAGFKPALTPETFVSFVVNAFSLTWLRRCRARSLMAMRRHGALRSLQP